MTFIIFMLSVSTGYPVNVSTSPYGINVHLVDNNVLQKVKDAGIKWIRIDADWSALELSRGTYDWAQMDRVTDYADANDLSVLAAIAYTPGWANNNQGIKHPAANVADWENFVRTIVNRYKTKVKYWNIWNEPNSLDFFAEGKDVFVEKIFLPAAKVIRDADPEAFIVGPELAHLTGTGAEWYFWMKYIFDQAGSYIDIVSHHVYKNEGVYLIYEVLETGETLIPSVQQIIEESGQQSKPFWITETGWETSSFAESVQADRYLEMLRQRRTRSYPHKIFFYEIIDDPSAGIDPWGVLRSDRSDKPSYAVYRDFIDGKYPDDGGGNGGGEEEKKRCYAQQTTGGNGGGGRSQILSNLRGIRDELMRLFPSARTIVDLYYELSDEMTNLSIRDSRVFHTGIKLMKEVDQFFTQNTWSNPNQFLGPRLTDTAKRLIDYLKEKNLSRSFKQSIAWSQRQLSFLKQMPLGKYLFLYLEKETQKLRNQNQTDYLNR
ncbi:MAG: cellulase family glycosylhydrolase [bacterium]|nr:cellulase family glycosylhydrolase [bacterium]